MDAEFKKLLNGGIWALNAPDNKDPSSTDVDPQLVRTAGFPSEYSTSSGVKPDRRRINQMFRELTGAAFEVRMGVSPYDAEVNYPVNAITQITGTLYRAVAANGPATTVVSPTDVGQTTWERVTGSVTEPEAPRDFSFDNSTANLIEVQWRNGRDGGSRIVRYDFQYRIHNAGSPNPWSPSASINSPFSFQRIGPFASGSQIQVRARAFTLSGDISEWGESTPSTNPNSTDRVRGNVPGGGNSLALLASQNGSLAALSWATPSNGGFPITRYIVQWRTEESQFSADNQQTTSPSNSTTISGLSYDTLYYFRVAAENSQGVGPWSNIARLTLVEGALVQPTLNRPTTSVTTSSFTANADWDNHPTNPTATPSSAQWQWSTDRGVTWKNDTFSQLSGFTRSNLTANTTYQVRYKLTTSLGTTDFSPIASFRTSANTIVTPPGTPSVSSSTGQRSGLPSSVTGFVTWGSVSENGLPVVGWDIRWTWSGGSFSQSAGRDTRNSSTSFTLPPGTRITVLVRARRADVSGGWGSSSFTLP